VDRRKRDNNRRRVNQKKWRFHRHFLFLVFIFDESIHFELGFLYIQNETQETIKSPNGQKKLLLLVAS